MLIAEALLLWDFQRNKHSRCGTGQQKSPFDIITVEEKQIETLKSDVSIV